MMFIFRIFLQTHIHSKVGIEVFYNDRDIEFIQIKRWLEKLYAEKTLQLDYNPMK